MAPTLTDTDGAVLDVLNLPAGPGADPMDPGQVERDFSRAMAAEDPSATQGPPPRTGSVPGEPKRRRGRPRKDPADQARVTSGPVPEAAPVDHAEAAAGLVTLAWATVAAIPYTTPFAAVIDANAGELTGALAAGAKHNPKIAAALEQAATGGGGVWAIQLAAVSVNMGMQCLEIMRDPKTREAATSATRSKFRAFLKTQGIVFPDVSRETEAGDASAAA